MLYNRLLLQATQAFLGPGYLVLALVIFINTVVNLDSLNLDQTG